MFDPDVSSGTIEEYTSEIRKLKKKEKKAKIDIKLENFFLKVEELYKETHEYIDSVLQKEND